MGLPGEQGWIAWPGVGDGKSVKTLGHGAIEELSFRPRRSGGAAATRPAFTLLELLTVVAVIALLLALLMPALRSAHAQARKLNCALNLRSVALEFHLFVENNSANGQGDSAELGPNRFRINDFQESLYQVDEFWDLGQETSGALKSGKSLMLCPAGPARLTKRRGFPCGRESLTPVENVTLAVNMRLYRGVVEVGGSSFLAPVRLTQVRSEILSHPYVPLLIDVDGKAAAGRGLEPFYTAPPRPGVNDPYADGRYWMPSSRHGGQTNVVFVGGHVLSSKRPEEETWNWGYVAKVGN